MKPPLFLLIFLLPAALSAQDIATHRVLTLRDSGLLVRFTVPNAPATFRPGRDNDYFYYLHDSIRSARGGYTGAVLDGPYEVLYDGRALHTRGQFSRGQKHGRWRYWYPDGQLRREENWKNSRLHGRFTDFDAAGRKTRSGKYRHGQLHGPVRLYEKGEPTGKQRYKNGEAQSGPRVRMPKFKKQPSGQ